MGLFDFVKKKEKLISIGEKANMLKFCPQRGTI